MGDKMIDDYWQRRGNPSPYNRKKFSLQEGLTSPVTSEPVSPIVPNHNNRDTIPSPAIDTDDDSLEDLPNISDLKKRLNQGSPSQGSIKSRKLSVAIRERDNQISKAGIRQIYFSFHFMKFGDIETKRQQFNAEILIRARWYEPELKSVISSGEELYKGILWDPQLYIVNLESVQSNIDHIWYDIKTDQDSNPYVTYNRRIRGNFFEKMELWEFPRDIQDLNITISSELGTDKVELVEDTVNPSFVDREMFQDEQNWYLYDHIEIAQTIPDPERTIKFSIPIISATCRVARNPRFYIWNNYFIMSCLAFLALTTFSIEPKDVKYRIATLLSLLLTTIVFKLSTTGQLPMISYHTLLDLYILKCMIFLVAVTCHVAFISLWKDDEFVAKWIDIVSITVVSFVLIVSHIVYIVGFFAITSKRRNEMRDKERANWQRKAILSAMHQATNTRPTIFTAQISHNGTLIIQEPLKERLPPVASNSKNSTNVSISEESC